MTMILRAGDLAPHDLARLLTGLRFPQGETVRAWLEAADGWSLDCWPGTEGRILWYGAGRAAIETPVQEVLPRLVGGRIFARSGELRWRRLEVLEPCSCRTVYLGQDRPDLEGLELTDALTGKTALHAQHPLWGLLSGTTRGAGEERDAWVELRVPHRFHYPVDSGAAASERLAVGALVETWVDDRGEPHFVRLCDLQAYPA